MPLLATAQNHNHTFDSSNETLMTATVLGGIASFAFACYQGKAPCSLSPNINTEKLFFSINYGKDNTISQLRLAIGADWLENIYASNNLTLNGRLEINTNIWQSSLNNPQNKAGFIIGLSPIFRYSSPKHLTNGYFELGSGPQLLSSTIIEHENKSTLFQFGSILGFGYSGKLLEIGYRYLHLSNANIAKPNPGTDFHSIHFAYKF